VLELNSVPCIEMHHFPSSGTPQNVAKALVDLFFKYYL
jgi:cyanophycin synthetase